MIDNETKGDRVKLIILSLNCYWSSLCAGLRRDETRGDETG